MVGPSDANVAPLVACTLDAGGQARRLREWAELQGQAVSRVETGTGVHYSFVGDDVLEQRIRRLASQERECCAFLEFGVSRRDDTIKLEVASDANGLEALRLIFLG